MEQGSTTHEQDVPLLSTNLQEPSVSVDDMIEQSIGSINSTQIVQAILVSIPSFFDSQQTFISVFAQADPEWHCTSNCTSNSNICTLSSNEWAWNSGKTHTSIISEWDLQCASSFITGFPSTCYFLGCLLGGLVLTTLGDSSWVGRKKLLFTSSLIMSLSAIACSFSPNVWVYSGLRFLCGVGRSPLAICAIVLLTERVGKRWRSHIVMVGFISSSSGILSLTFIAYATRDISWRSLYLATSVPGVLCCIVSYFFVFESPRWLFMQGQENTAMLILRRLGSFNFGEQISPRSFIQTRPTNSNNPFTPLKTLFKSRWAMNRLLVSMMLNFGIGLMYFGMFLGVENLGFDIYLTSVFNGMLLLCSYFIAFLYWIQRCNRRTSLLGFCIISGATSIVISILPGARNWVIIGLELVSLLCACMSYSIVSIYTVELFPTCVRNSASSLVRQAMILGSVFDPMLIVLGKEKRVYSYGVFGFVMIFSGFLVLFLPEARGTPLCDTMEEQQHRDYGKDCVI